jgi:methylation protein MtfA
VYDADGAPIYHDLAAADGFEVREIIRGVRGVPGRVLDLAAGSGRFTFPLLALGREVTALDLSPDMLDILTRRLDSAPARIRSRCTVVQSDMATFQLQSKFSCIVLGTTSISLLDASGRAGLFRAVAAHLEPGGQFQFTVLERGDLCGPDEVVARVVGASGKRYDLYDHWPAGALSRTVTIIPADPPAGPVQVCTGEVWTSDFSLVEHELAEASLEIRERRPLTRAGERHHVTLIEAGSTR